MRKYFDRYTLAGAAIALLIWLAAVPSSTVAGIIQAIIPAAVPTANKQGSTGTKFLIATGAFSTNDCVQVDASGNASSAGGACGIAGVAGPFNSISSGTNTTAAMVVGAGSSMNYTGAGTINASSLQLLSAFEGNGSKFQLFTGSDPSTNDCAKFDANHNIVGAGAACGTGSGSTFSPPYVTPDGTNFYGPVYSLTSPGALTGQTTTTGNNGGSINSAVTSVIVTSSSGFPTVPFIVQIGTEDIKVTVVVGTTWTITRGYDGTSAASHTDGATVTLLKWQWINQSTATALSTNNAISLSAPAGPGSASWRILKQIQPATAYTAIAAFLPTFPTGNTRVGVLFRESSSGKLVTFTMLQSEGLEFAAWNSPTSFSTNSANGFTFSSSPIANGTLMWFKIVNPLSGSRTVSWSSDGQNWVQFGTNAFNQFLTADEIGFGVDTENATFGVAMELIHWAVTTP